jgi:hypothetical protein
MKKSIDRLAVALAKRHEVIVYPDYMSLRTYRQLALYSLTLFLRRVDRSKLSYIVAGIA